MEEFVRSWKDRIGKTFRVSWLPPILLCTSVDMRCIKTSDGAAALVVATVWGRRADFDEYSASSLGFKLSEVMWDDGKEMQAGI